MWSGKKKKACLRRNDTLNGECIWIYRKRSKLLLYHVNLSLSMDLFNWAQNVVTAPASGQQSRQLAKLLGSRVLPERLVGP